MASDAHPDTPDPARAEPDLQVGGVRLASLAERSGPFGSLFVGPGSRLRERAQIAIDSVPVPAPYAGQLLASIEGEHARSQVVFADGADVWRFLLEDPLSADIARFGDLPSLGPIIEASQVTTPHVVVTIEDDVFGVTNFGTVESVPSPEVAEGQTQDPRILEALDHVVDLLHELQPRLVALMGTHEEIVKAQQYLQRELPFMRFNAYPSDDIDHDLLATADDIVRDAASLAAERRTHELAHFRQARSAAQTQEGVAAIGAIEEGSAQRLLVHDDLIADQHDHAVRTADRAIVAALRAGVPITMIPNVPVDRGPKDGIGVIIQGEGAAIQASTAEPEDSDDVRLSV